MPSLRFFLIAALLLGVVGVVREPRIDPFLSAPIHDGIVLTPDPADSAVWKSESMTLPQGSPCAISLTVDTAETLDVFFETPSGETTRHLRIFVGSDRNPWRAVLPAPASSCRLVLKQTGSLVTKPVFERVAVQNVNPHYYRSRTAVRVFRFVAILFGIAAFLWGGWLERAFLKKTLKRVLFEPSAEIERCLVLLGFGVWLFWPLFAPRLSGTGDASGYISVLADTLEQARHGVFPVWAGQSQFSFSGFIFPLRYAPMYQHLGLLIDFLTFHSLSVFAINASILVLSGLGGLGVCYGALRSVVPDHPWLAMLLAWLYVSCPGVYGLIPIYDMYMSWVALPWLPLAFWGMARSLQRSDLPSRLLQAIGLALLLWCHSPLAMWSMIVAATVNLWRMIYFRPKLSEYLWDAGAGILFIALAVYPLVSVHSLAHTLLHENNLDLIYSLIADNYPYVIMPLFKGWGHQFILQPGFGVLALFVLGCWGLCFKENRRYLPLGFLAIIFVALLFPIPWFSHWLVFHAIPRLILGLNRIWLDQRLDAILAITAVFLVAVTSTHVRPSKTLGRLIVFLGAALLFWSLYQVNYLRKLQSHNTHNQASGEWLLKRGCTFYGNYFKNGDFKDSRYLGNTVIVAPEMELRLLDPEASKIVSSNIEFVAPGYGPASEFGKMKQRRLSVPLTGKLMAGDSGFIHLEQTLLLEPHKQYLLAFSFLKPNPDPKGELIISGKGVYQNEPCYFNRSERSWGTDPESSHIIALQSFWDQPKEINLTWQSSDPSLAESFSGHFADCELIEYQKETLPIQIDSFIPFRASVQNPAAGWLETFRYYMPGYAASVDGRPAEIKPSQDGMVLIKMPAGAHRTELNYKIAPVVEFAYFLNLGLFAFVLIGTVLFRKRLFKALPSPASQP